MYRRNKAKRSLSRFVFAAVALSFFAAAGQPVKAQDTWLLQICEKENQLVHPTDPMWMKSNMWDVSYQRMNERSMPVLELTNLQPAGGPDITTFEMTIGDTRFHFADDYLGAYAVLGNSTPGFQLTSTAPGGDLLRVNIVGGLSPGETVRFRIDINVDDGLPFFSHPDYRTVLFDMNGINVYGNDPNIPSGQDDNATAFVAFSNGTFSDPATFIDEVVIGPAGQYYNNIFRPYGVMESVDIFRIGGGGFVIPEPSSALLGLAGLFGGLWLTGRARRA